MRKQKVKRMVVLVIILVCFFTSLTPQAQVSPRYGDANDDGTVTILDALMIARYYVGLAPAGFVESAADVDGSGSVTIIDALLVAQYYVGLINIFPAQTGGVAIVKSNVERELNPVLEAGELQAVVTGNNQFGFDLFQTVRTNTDNLFFSPMSISYAFAMCYAGAAGNTAAEIADTMHFTLPVERFHPAYNALDLRLTGEPVNPDPHMGEEMKLHIANSTWGQKDYYFYPRFLDILAGYYGAGMNTVDFQNAPDPSRILINNWVSDQTAARINDLLPPGSVTPLCRLILVNAIYFKAVWFTPFLESATYEESFYPQTGNAFSIPMMHQTQTARYYEVPGQYQAVKLNYQGTRRNSMLIILPAEGQLDTFQADFTNATFNTIKQNMLSCRVKLTLPKFSFQWGDYLNNSLKSMGMVDAFSFAQADFSGITNAEKIYISDVIHKAFIAVDEKGTEAAAATAIILAGAGLNPTPTPQPPVNMTINRPFLFVICNDDTGAILFIGRVMHPAL